LASSRSASQRAALAFQASRIAPAPVKASDLVVTIEPVGRMPVSTNATSPVVAGSDLLLVDQTGSLYRWDGSTAQPILSLRTAPSALKPVGTEALVNVASNETGTVVYVVFTSSVVPRGVPSRKSTRPGANAWQVFYKYDFAAGALSNPKPFAALEVRTDGHTGGGLAALADGSVLFATGDNGDAGRRRAHLGAGSGEPHRQDSADLSGRWPRHRRRHRCAECPAAVDWAARR
jgi:hypothetical protein